MTNGDEGSGGGNVGDARFRGRDAAELARLAMPHEYRLAYIRTIGALAVIAVGALMVLLDIANGACQLNYLKIGEVELRVPS